MSADKILAKLTLEAIAKLDLAMSELFKLPKNDKYEKYDIGALGRSIGLIREFQKPIFERCPELKPPLPDDYVPDPPLNDEELALVSKLKETDIEKIDEALLSNSCENWRKVARIVGTTMMNFIGRVPGIPDIYYAQRVRHLVEKGMLESQGNLAFMRYSEVRLPSNRKDTT